MPAVTELQVADDRDLVSLLLTRAQDSLDRDTELARALLVQALGLLGQDGQRSRCGQRKGMLPAWQLRRVTAHVDARLGAEIRVCHLAALLGLSVSHFSRVFKQTTGMSPREYVNQRRIASACKIMLATKEPLTWIAHQHGFCDQSHFTRAFQLEVGMAPNEWRLLNGPGGNRDGGQARLPAVPVAV